MSTESLPVGTTAARLPLDRIECGLAGMYVSGFAVTLAAPSNATTTTTLDNHDITSVSITCRFSYDESGGSMARTHVGDVADDARQYAAECAGGFDGVRALDGPGAAPTQLALTCGGDALPPLGGPVNATGAATPTFSFACPAGQRLFGVSVGSVDGVTRIDQMAFACQEAA